MNPMARDSASSDEKATPDLATLQQEFSRVLHYQPNALPAVNGLADSDALLQIYRNNFVITLAECLALVYPAVAALTGNECFDAIARQHVLTTPMTQPSAELYGQGFDATIAGLPNITGAAPYLPDVATLEWFYLLASQTPAHANTFPFEQLSLVPAERLGEVKMELDGNLRWLESEFAIVDIWSAIKDNAPGRFDAIDVSAGQTALLKMVDGGVEVRAIDRQPAALLAACESKTLAEIDPSLLEYLSPLAQQGAFKGFTLPDNADG